MLFLFTKTIIFISILYGTIFAPVPKESFLFQENLEASGLDDRSMMWLKRLHILPAKSGDSPVRKVCMPDRVDSTNNLFFFIQECKKGLEDYFLCYSSYSVCPSLLLLSQQMPEILPAIARIHVLQQLNLDFKQIHSFVKKIKGKFSGIEFLPYCEHRIPNWWSSSRLFVWQNRLVTVRVPSLNLYGLMSLHAEKKISDLSRLDDALQIMFKNLINFLLDNYILSKQVALADLEIEFNLLLKNNETSSEWTVPVLTFLRKISAKHQRVSIAVSKMSSLSQTIPYFFDPAGIFHQGGLEHLFPLFRYSSSSLYFRPSNRLSNFFTSDSESLSSSDSE